jgi:hypothetical protein
VDADRGRVCRHFDDLGLQEEVIILIVKMVVRDDTLGWRVSLALTYNELVIEGLKILGLHLIGELLLLRNLMMTVHFGLSTRWINLEIY